MPDSKSRMPPVWLAFITEYLTHLFTITSYAMVCQADKDTTTLKLRMVERGVVKEVPKHSH